ncbi:MAG: hypothetical protein GY711_31965 [bacterium]|nr:hypothetical protein [bacterium]
MRPPWALLVLAAVCVGGGCASAPVAESHVTLERDDAAGALRFVVDGRELFVYRYGEEWAIPHIWPLRSPSGRSLLVQRTEPYPHHRSLWVVDRVRLADGPDTDFYHEWKNLRDAEHPELGHHSFIRHEGFSELRPGERGGAATAELRWIVQDETPVLDQRLRFELLDLGDGEYALDLSWELRASHGEVEFLSDWVHYGWPYLRMDPAFSGEHGGTITDDRGRQGQEATNGQYARWVDYSNAVDGIAEGVAVLVAGDDEPHKWLTREYGTFGPRRPDARSGTKFELRRGETLRGRVILFVHRGDVRSGRVAERLAELGERLDRAGQ